MDEDVATSAADSEFFRVPTPTTPLRGQENNKTRSVGYLNTMSPLF